MPAPGLWDDIAAVAGVPLVVWALACGQGLLVERVLRVRLPNALLLVIGFCTSVILALGVYCTHAGNWLAIPVLVVLALCGFVLARKDLPGRLNAGWALLAGLAVYLLFDASVLIDGHWVISGYNLENDSAYELLLVSHLQQHGTAAASAVPSTANSAIASYLTTGYPLGSQSLLGVVSGVLGVSAAVAWQSFISAVAAVAAVAASQLSGRTMDRRVAAFAGAIAVAGAITYQYALQGSIKEIAVMAAVLCALAIIRHAILELRSPVAALAMCAIPLAAILIIYNAAGLPYAGAVGGSGVVAAVIYHRGLPGREWVRPVAIALLVLVVASIPALLTIKTFFHVASSGFTGPQATAPALGPLLRKLPLSEISGVWLLGDYRFPVPPGTNATLTIVATVAILLLLAPAVLKMIAAREPGPLMGLVSMALVLLIAYPKLTPYAQAKLLAIASPIVLLCAAQAFTRLKGWDWNGLATVAALALAVAVVVSDAKAYHAFPVSSSSRMLALKQITADVPEGPAILDSEFEQFAKYFAQPSSLVDGPDNPTPRALELLDPALPQYGHSFDLGEEQLGFVESFPYVLTRRSPATTIPPSNYSLLSVNGFYELWKRTGGAVPYAQLPLRSPIGAGARLSCRRLGSFVKGARPGSRLVVAQQPPRYGFTMSEATERSPFWGPTSATAVGTPTPGRASRQMQIPAGRYELWIEGNLPRKVSVTLDGRAIGSAQGVNAPEEWLSAGSAQIAGGSHQLGVLRGGGGLGPGDGSGQAGLGAVALAPLGARPKLLQAPVGNWRSLCGIDAYWAELAS